MGKILDNPKEFFDSLSSEEFQNLLDEFGFNYKKVESLNDNMDLIKNYSKIISCQSNIINNSLSNCLNKIKLSNNIIKENMSKEFESLYIDTNIYMDLFNKLFSKTINEVKESNLEKNYNEDRYKQSKTDLEAA